MRAVRIMVAIGDEHDGKFTPLRPGEMMAMVAVPPGRTVVDAMLEAYWIAGSLAADLVDQVPKFEQEDRDARRKAVGDADSAQ